MTAIMIDAQPVLRALIDMGVSRTRIARTVGCEVQTVQCWLFGLPMNATRREQWVLKLIEFAADVSMLDGGARKPIDQLTGPAAVAANGAFRMLMDVLRAVERES